MGHGMSPLKNRPTTLKGADRVEFDLDEFERAIEQDGYFATWSKALVCPNRDPLQDDHHRISCQLCNAAGFVYYSSVDIRVLASSFNANQKFLPESHYEPGTVYMTTRPQYKLSFWDKIELLNSEARYSEVKAIQSGTTTYRLRYAVTEVDYVVTSTGKYIDPSSITVTLDGKVEFSVVEPNTLEGDFFAISYKYHPIYIVIDLLHHVRDSRLTVSGVDVQADFPTQAVARLDYLVFDSGEGD